MNDQDIDDSYQKLGKSLIRRWLLKDKLNQLDGILGCLNSDRAKLYSDWLEVNKECLTLFTELKQVVSEREDANKDKDAKV